VGEPDGRPIVFVVDDDPAVCEALSSLIRSVGLRVKTVASAAEFLRQRPPAEPSCLVLVVGLPGLSGMDLQRELAATHRHLPIILITGQGDIPTTVICCLSRNASVSPMISFALPVLQNDAIARFACP
jgi:FixJ family two-component response regulator